MASLTELPTPVQLAGKTIDEMPVKVTFAAFETKNDSSDNHYVNSQLHFSEENFFI